MGLLQTVGCKLQATRNTPVMPDKHNFQMSAGLSADFRAGGALAVVGAEIDHFNGI